MMTACRTDVEQIAWMYCKSQEAIYYLGFAYPTLAVEPLFCSVGINTNEEPMSKVLEMSGCSPFPYIQVNGYQSSWERTSGTISRYQPWFCEVLLPEDPVTSSVNEFQILKQFRTRN